MIYLGLGSNVGPRHKNLTRAVRALQQHGLQLRAISPVIETPALLPPEAKPDWARPYLNCVVAGDADWQPLQGLAIAQHIEAELGRVPAARWSPRPLDIDLLLWDELDLASEPLTLPHPAIAQRTFVLSALAHLIPNRILPRQTATVLQLSRQVGVVPLWMGIVNLSADSFSDDGRRDTEAVTAAIERLIAEHVHIIDLGAESTRPNASPITPTAEWQRLQPVLDALHDRLQAQPLRPLISVDSRHWRTIARALTRGLDLVNDVSGLTDPNMRDLIRDSTCQVVAMHSVSIPADSKQTLASERSAVVQIHEWFSRRVDEWLAAGLDISRIIVDPGIGFGTNALQSLALLRECAAFGDIAGTGLRVLIGHSRKSFMRNFSPPSPAARDVETLGLSLALCARGVEMIRVHDPILHQRAYRAWAHLAPTPQP